MKSITYNNNSYPIKDDETVLDCLLRHDVDIQYACKSGVCHVCTLQCNQGDVGFNAVAGLSCAQIENGHFLSCQCVPIEELIISDIDEAGLFTQALVKNKTFVSESICTIQLKPATELYYKAGQFINIKMNDQHIRSYSIASLPAKDQNLELHIKKMENGRLSNWMFDDVKSGDIIDIQGPFGECYYPVSHTHNPMIMIATGTGIAPILGILRDAINCQHQGQINIYHGDKYISDLYTSNILEEIESNHSNIHYHPAASEDTNSAEGVYHGRASELAFRNHVDLNDHLIYLCGSPEMVEEAKSRSLSRGAESRMIHADPFVTKDLRLNLR